MTMDSLAQKNSEKTSSNPFPLVMKSIALLTALATVFFTVLYRFFPEGWIISTAISFGTTCYHFAMRLLIGLVVPMFSKKIRADHRWFRQHGFEPFLYKRLRTKNWKGKLPTYDPSQFSLTSNTLEEVVLNTCRAELVHEVIMVCSFVPLFFALAFDAFPVFLITSVLAALYDSIFVIAQRYNRPRLERILKKRRS